MWTLPNIEWIGAVASGITIGSVPFTAKTFVSSFSVGKNLERLRQETEAGFSKVEGELFKIRDFNDNLHLIGEKLTEIEERLWRTESNGLEFSEAIESAIDFESSPFVRSESGIFIHDNVLDIPEGLSEKILQSPADFFVGVGKIELAVPEDNLLNDPTLVPWLFEIDGDAMIGFAKRGFMNSLGMEFRPLFERWVPQTHTKLRTTSQARFPNVKTVGDVLSFDCPKCGSRKVFMPRQEFHEQRNCFGCGQDFGVISTIPLQT